MIEISKELLSEVLDYDVDKYTIVSSTEITQIRIWKKDAETWDYRSYDIHYLAHKCKQWALSKGYVLVAWYENEKGYVRITKSGFGGIGLLNSNTEVEAVIKACTYIFNNLSNK